MYQGQGNSIRILFGGDPHAQCGLFVFTVSSSGFIHVSVCSMAFSPDVSKEYLERHTQACLLQPDEVKIATDLLTTYPQLKENPKRKSRKEIKDSKLLSTSSSTREASAGTLSKTPPALLQTLTTKNQMSSEGLGNATDGELDIDPVTGALRKSRKRLESAAHSGRSKKQRDNISKQAETDTISAPSSIATRPPRKKKKRRIMDAEKKQPRTGPVVLQVSTLNLVNRLHFS